MSVKLGEWVGLGWVPEGVLYCIQNGTWEAFCNFPFGKDMFFFSEAHYVVCVSAFVLIFLVFSILFKVSTVIKKQDRYIYICIYSYTYTQLLKMIQLVCSCFSFSNLGCFKFRFQIPAVGFFFVGWGISTVGSRWILAAKTVPWQPRDTRRQRERLPGPSRSTGLVWRTLRF